MIEKDENGAINITIGDEDVLTGFTRFEGGVRIFLAPLPEGHGLPFNELVESDNVMPPANTAVTIYFVNRTALAEFARGLTEYAQKWDDPPAAKGPECPQEPCQSCGLPRRMTSEHRGEWLCGNRRCKLFGVYV